jgi:beta-lactamase regulating signal transducer with metallopeptidase domain/HEAT repeat protein
VNWFEPVATGLTQHILAGLLLSVGTIIPFLVASPLLINVRRGRAATSQRILSLLFLVLAIAPISSSFQLFRSSLENLKSHPSGFAEPSHPHPTGQFIAHALSRELMPELSEHQGSLVWRRIVSVNWPILLAVFWAILVFLLLARLLLAVKALWTLHRQVRILPLPRKTVCRRRIALAESALIQAPMAIGLWAPKVLVPPNLAEELSQDDWNQILLHEIAHLERYDDWSNFIQRLFLAFNPFNPFLWLVGRDLQVFRELVCDDWVVARVARPKIYAQLLARLAVRDHPSPALASGVSHCGRQLYQRVSRILASDCDRELRPSPMTTLFVSLGLLAISVTGICLLPVITFPSPIRAENPPSIPEDRSSEHSPANPPVQAVPAGTPDPEIIALLKNSAQSDNDPYVREEAVVSLSSINIDQATEALLQILDESKEDRTKIFILHCFSRRHSADPRVRDKLRELTAPSNSLLVRLAALDQLVAVEDEGAADQFIAIYRSTVEQSVKERCLRGLASAGSKSARDFLMATATSDSDPDMRRTALRVLTERLSGGRRPLVEAMSPATGEGDLDAPGPTFDRDDSLGSGHEAHSGRPMPPPPADTPGRQEPARRFGQTRPPSPGPDN